MKMKSKYFVHLFIESSSTISFDSFFHRFTTFLKNALLPSFFYSFLPSFLPLSLPPFHPSSFHPFLPSFISFFLPSSLLPTLLPFLPSFFPFFLSQISVHCLFNNNAQHCYPRLKVRIKALSSTVETQSSRITDLMSAQAMAGLEGGNKTQNMS